MRRAFRSRQRGFIYLTTGANGAGKTLNTLKWVRDRQVKESRPVYYNGRFEMTADFGWQVIDFKDWQTLPDGAIVLVDECHNDLPLRPPSSTPPEHVRMLAEHRRRGFDFYLISQHPQNIDSFVRRLIGSPGWHRHLKRPFGGDLVSVLEWAAVNPNCEKNGAGKDAKVSMVGFPKEVYDWYKSASLHTGKKSIPKQVYVLGLLALLLPLLVFAVVQVLRPKSVVSPGPDRVMASAPVVPGAAGAGGRAEKQPMTAEEYAASFVPRVAGFPQSAPRYDDLAKAAQVPKPAACIHGVRRGESKESCSCWTQQATLVVMDEGLCVQIAAGGWFDDTVAPAQSVPSIAGGVVATSAVASAPEVVAVAAESHGYGLRDSAFLSSRNAAVQSVVKPPQPVR